MQPTPPSNKPLPAGLTSSPYALAELSERCMGNAAIAALVLDKFESQLHSDVAAIERDLNSNDADRVARTAHALKGAAGAVAASALHELAAQVEASARQDRLDVVVQQLGSLRAEVERCLHHLPAARASLAADPGSGRPGTEVPK